MSCLTKEQMQGYIDAELSVEETRAVQVHMDQCQNCREKVAKLKLEREKMMEWMDLLVDNRPKIPVFIPPVQKRKKKRAFVKLLLYGAAAAALLVFVLQFFVSNQETKVPLVSNQNCVPEKIEESFMMEVDFANGVDANKPVHQQQMVITVIDANGRIVDSI